VPSFVWVGERHGPDRRADWTDVDYRGLTPLFWRHVTPYGEGRQNMTKRLTLSTPT
jgi:hypothetical protein